MAGRKRGTTTSKPAPRSAVSTTTKESSDSGRGSTPLSDPYVATHTSTTGGRGGTTLVQEPEGAASLSMQRRSSRLQNITQQPSKLSAPHKIYSKDAPDGKRKPGWQYEVLAVVLATLVNYGTATAVKACCTIHSNCCGP